MGVTGLAVVKLGSALIAAACSLWLARGANRAAKVLLAVSAVLALCAYFRFFQLPGGFVHRWEMFHYYVGSKYHQELGYKNLYRCAAVVDAEDGLKSSPNRRIRDLDNDGVMTASQAVAEAPRCRSAFTGARWHDFEHDVRFFRRGLGRAWGQAQLDHGYNPPPLWTATWGRVAQAVPLSLRHLQALAFADLLLMAGTLVALGWGFGFRTAALGAVFWGTQAASEVGWTGGGLGRQDWLFFCVLGVCALRRNRFGLGGASLMLAGMLRLFPLLLLLGPVVVLLVRAMQQRSISSATRRFALGAALAMSLGLAATAIGKQHLAEDYKSFWSHIQLRREAIVSNHMGLKTLLSSAPVATASRAKAAAEAHEPKWLAERRSRLEELGGGVRVAIALAVLLVGLAMAQSGRAWVGAALATTLIPLTLDPANYYYSFFLLLVPLMAQRRALSVLLCVVAAGGQLLCMRWGALEMRFAALSWLYVGAGFVVALTFVRWRWSRVAGFFWRLQHAS